MSSIKIQLVSAEQIYPLRHRILRPGQDFAKSVYADDSLPTTFHVAAFIDDVMVGVATFSVESHKDLAKMKANAKAPYRLRGMATDTHLHKRGVGAAVLQFSFEELNRRGCDLLWCNARKIAFPFYEKLGFSYLGEMFELPDIGPHKVMYKSL